MPNSSHTPDPDANKGAVEQNSPEQPTNTSMEGQLPHRTENPLIKSNDTDYPEPGENAEHSGEPEVGDTAAKPDPRSLTMLVSRHDFSRAIPSHLKEEGASAFYSYLSATIGSTLVARRAGM